LSEYANFGIVSQCGLASDTLALKDSHGARGRSGKALLGHDKTATLHQLRKVRFTRFRYIFERALQCLRWRPDSVKIIVDLIGSALAVMAIRMIPLPSIVTKFRAGLFGGTQSTGNIGLSNFSRTPRHQEISYSPVESGGDSSGTVEKGNARGPAPSFGSLLVRCLARSVGAAARYSKLWLLH
jgi:hypothetical protein